MQEQNISKKGIKSIYKLFKVNTYKPSQTKECSRKQRASEIDATVHNVVY